MGSINQFFIFLFEGNISDKEIISKLTTIRELILNLPENQNKVTDNFYFQDHIRLILSLPNFFGVIKKEITIHSKRFTFLAGYCNDSNENVLYKTFEGIFFLPTDYTVYEPFISKYFPEQNCEINLFGQKTGFFNENNFFPIILNLKSYQDKNQQNFTWNTLQKILNKSTFISSAESEIEDYSKLFTNLLVKLNNKVNLEEDLDIFNKYIAIGEIFQKSMEQLSLEKDRSLKIY